MSELREGLLKELSDAQDAEQQLLKALPKMEKAAMAGELKSAFADHADETQGHLERIQEIFEMLGATAPKQTCQTMRGLIAETERRIQEHEGDAVLIAMAQKIEHYEIATYGTLRSWASLLEEDDVADALAEILDEEKAADERLTEVAESAVNIEAAEGEAGQEEDEEEETPAESRRSRHQE